MFSDGRASAPGEQRGFKPHGPHFIPWLRCSLKPPHGGDLGLNGPCEPPAELRGRMTPLERAKGMGLFSIPGKDRAKKGEPRCNGVGVGRMLPVVLRGHHILPGGLGKRRDPEPDVQMSPEEWPQGGGSRSSVRGCRPGLLQSKNDRAARTQGPPAGLSPEEPKPPLVVCVEDGRGAVWDHASHTPHPQRDLRPPPGSGSRGLGCSYTRRQRGSSGSQRDLTAPREPPVERPDGSLNGVPVPGGRPGPGGKEAGGGMKVVRGQIKRVVDNLEHVLTALRDVQQEMREVVQQIDSLTSSIDLNEDERWGAGGGGGAKPYSDSSFSSGSSSGKATAAGTLPRPCGLREETGCPDPSGTAGRSHRGPRHSSGCSPEWSRTLGSACGLGSPSRQGGGFADNPPSSNPPQLWNLTPQDCTASPQRTPPARPPTPGLSPLTINLHPPNSPDPQPRSPVPSPSLRLSPVSSCSRLSTKAQPPPIPSPSVAAEPKSGSYRTPQSDHPSVGPLSPSSGPSATCPLTDSETLVSDAHRETGSSARGAPRVLAPAAHGRRGRKPPPYPHHRLSEHTKNVKEPRQAPPYPEKRRLLSTTV